MHSAATREGADAISCSRLVTTLLARACCARAVHNVFLARRLVTRAPIINDPRRSACRVPDSLSFLRAPRVSPTVALSSDGQLAIPFGAGSFSIIHHVRFSWWRRGGGAWWCVVVRGSGNRDRGDGGTVAVVDVVARRRSQYCAPCPHI